VIEAKRFSEAQFSGKSHVTLQTILFALENGKQSQTFVKVLSPKLPFFFFSSQ
jgi:hypothetical protein